jgi:hypothetical protein
VGIPVAFLAGERVTAARLNRLQPTSYYATASSALSGPQTLADVPGCTQTFSVDTAGAIYVVHAVFDYRLSGTPTTLGSGNIYVDGVVQTQFATFRDGGGSLGSTASVAQVYRGSFSTTGSHTIKMVASPVSGQQINIYSSLLVTIYEIP